MCIGEAYSCNTIRYDMCIPVRCTTYYELCSALLRDNFIRSIKYYLIF